MLLTFKPASVCLIMKYVHNGIPTSHRMHATIRKSCIFGCSGGLDVVSHYNSCPVWHTVFSAIESFYPEFIPTTYASVMCRLGIPFDLNPLCCPIHLFSVGLFTYLYQACMHNDHIPNTSELYNRCCFALRKYTPCLPKGHRSLVL